VLILPTFFEDIDRFRFVMQQIVWHKRLFDFFIVRVLKVRPGIKKNIVAAKYI
jgi:hypothetical protein